MAHQPINLHEIDFSQPDREFIYKRQTYQIKNYSNYYFFRNKKHTNHEFIYSFNYSTYFDAVKNVFQKNSSPLNITQTIQEKDYLIQRCVQYKKSLFSFGRGTVQYYSPKYNQWIYIWCFKCNDPGYISLDKVFKKPYAFFVEQAVSVYEQELPLIKNEKKFVSFMKETTKAIEFIRGSKSELEKLTKLAAFTLPELRFLFERYSSFRIIYESENYYQDGGVIEAIDWDYEVIICTEERSIKDGEEIFSKQAEQLFNLIFEYNYFSGLYWEIGTRKPKYNDCFCVSETIEVKVESPAQHERLEAALELQSWLKGKLPEEEIRAYFEW